MSGLAWLRIARDLCDEITHDVISVGEQIPSTTTLCDRYGVAGGTVRNAVNHLRAVGVVAGIPGKGVYVKRLPTEQDLALTPRRIPLASRIEELERRVARLEERDEPRP